MLTEEETQFLCRTALFTGYAPEELRELLLRTAWEDRRFDKGEIIFSPARFQEKLGVLLSGRVLVTKGEGELVVSVLEAGSLFGAGALFNEAADYVSTLTARSRCHILFFSQQTMRELIDGEDRVCHNYIRYLSGRIRFLSGKIDALIQGSGEKKLSSYLLRQMDGCGRVEPACSMTELAARLNMGRASLYRELGKLEQRGVLAREGKAILILQPEILAR